MGRARKPTVRALQSSQPFTTGGRPQRRLDPAESERDRFGPCPALSDAGRRRAATMADPLPPTREVTGAESNMWAGIRVQSAGG